MNSLKRSSPVQGHPIIIIDSDSEEVVVSSEHKDQIFSKEFEEYLSPYDAIPEIPNIKLTVQQMKSDPLELFDQLQKLYSAYGAVKLTISQAWHCPVNFGYVDRHATVRKQIIPELREGKAFQQNAKSIRIPTYRQNAIYFSKKYKFRTNPKGDTLQSKRQHEYWNLVTKPQCRFINYKDKNQKVVVEYAADLPSSSFGSGFPTRKVYNWEDTDFQYHTNYFNLNNLYKSPTSLLRIISQKEEKISGISIPWMYVGMQFATFCWHVEDMFLNSVNYNHQGETKTWYIIPGHQKELFDEYVRKNYEGSRKKNLLEKITLMIDPLQLIRAGIHIFKAHQRPRDYILTFAKAYHCGFSHGYNVGEAVNFVSFSSIQIIKEAIQYYAEQELALNKRMRSHVISFQWIIYQSINKGLIIPQKYKKSVETEYQKVINKQYNFIVDTLARYGEFQEVKLMKSSKKKYFHNMCNYCKNYIYLTTLECLFCHKNLCESHLDKCECTVKPIVRKWILVIRQLNKDRERIRQLVPLITEKQTEIDV